MLYDDDGTFVCVCGACVICIQYFTYIYMYVRAAVYTHNITTPYCCFVLLFCS